MLKLAGYLNLLISFFHFAALFALQDAFRLTGVSDRMARLTDVHPAIPVVATLIVAVVFALFGLYALKAAGVVKWKLPLVRPAVYAIGAVYVLRGITGLVHRYGAEAPDFLQVLFALAALGIGSLYIVGGTAAFGRK